MLNTNNWTLERMRREVGLFSFRTYQRKLSLSSYIYTTVFENDTMNGTDLFYFDSFRQKSGPKGQSDIVFFEFGGARPTTARSEDLPVVPVTADFFGVLIKLSSKLVGDKIFFVFFQISTHEEYEPKKCFGGKFDQQQNKKRMCGPALLRSSKRPRGRNL